MKTATVTLHAHGGASIARSLEEGLTATTKEEVRGEANRWIKRLRLVDYDGRTMRQRFSYRGDSLWWFTELYLHKMRALDRALETILALEHLVATEAPASVTVRSDDAGVREAARAFGAAHGLPVAIDGAAGRGQNRRAMQAFLVGSSAILSRWRQGPAPRPPHAPRVAAFVHSAFWREVAGAEESGHESYIGPVLDAVRTTVASDDLFYVGVGPRRNFRQRRWWDPLVGGGPGPTVTPIERFARQDQLTEALALWRDRETLAAAIVAGPAIREAGLWRGYDLWTVLSDALAGAARVQWPWSARSMDEARAALEALRPGTVVTYAEAGGWGRALVLEARRAGVSSVGVQHGFIYRHWLNYQHEPDEMAPEGDDRGFPRPDRTLLFDRYAASTLETAGHFPATALLITGSPRLDELAARCDLARADRPAARAALGIAPDEHVVVVAAKFTEIRGELAALMDALATMPNVRGLIKPHPAESAEVYGAAVAGQSRVSVLDRHADLGALLGIADALVTMNSTVAIDALVLGVPACVVGLPNNLTPFVDAGVMIGAAPTTLRTALEAVLYDAEGRASMIARGAAFAARHAMAASGGAARCAAEAIVETPDARPHRRGESQENQT